MYERKLHIYSQLEVLYKCMFEPRRTNCRIFESDAKRQYHHIENRTFKQDVDDLANLLLGQRINECA
jgi:hypothetical protein